MLHVELDVVSHLLAGLLVARTRPARTSACACERDSREPAFDEQDVEPLLHAARLATYTATTRRAPIRREP
jgi:hypothetical protein